MIKLGKKTVVPPATLDSMKISEKVNEIDNFSKSNSSKIDILSSDVNGVSTQLAEKANDDLFFKPIKLPNYNADGITNIDTIKVADVYALWDALIAKYPDYLTKTILGKDQSGVYDLWKISYNNPNTSYKKFKTLIFANIHGHEPNGDAKAPAILAYEMMRNMIENNINNKVMQEFFYSYKFDIIPIANPWGFDNDSRRNSRGVDLNRNFNFEWDKSWNGSTDPTNHMYRGTSATSEAETQIYQSFINGSDADLLCDMHCWGFKNWYGDNRYIYYTNDGSKTIDVANVSFNYLSKKYNKVIETTTSGGGGVKSYGEKVKGIPSITIEFQPFVAGKKPYESSLMTDYMEMYVNFIYTYKRLYGQADGVQPITKFFVNTNPFTITSTTYNEITNMYQEIPVGFDGTAVFHGSVSISSGDTNTGGVYICPKLGQDNHPTRPYETPYSSAWEIHSNGGYRVTVPFHAVIDFKKGSVKCGMQFKLSANTTTNTASIIKYRAVLQLIPNGSVATKFLT